MTQGSVKRFFRRADNDSVSYSILIACVAAVWAFLSQLGAAEQARRAAKPPAADRAV